MVIEYTGMIVRTQVADLREAQYARRGLGCYMFALDDGRIIDATQRGNVARYINHSCGGGDGNVETNTRTGRMEAKGKGPNCMAKYFTVVRPFHSLPSYPTSRGSHKGCCRRAGSGRSSCRRCARLRSARSCCTTTSSRASSTRRCSGSPAAAAPTTAAASSTSSCYL